MNFGEAIQTCFQKYAIFKGRARRSEFWYWCLFHLLVGFSLGLIPKVGIVFLLLLYLPSFAVTIRRLHDVGKSGWNYLWIMLPIIGSILILIWSCRDSEPGENIYGPNPKGISSDKSDLIQRTEKK